MRNALCLVFILAAGCGISNKVAPDGAAVDGVVTGTDDGSGSGSSAALTIALTDKPAELGNVAAVTFGFQTSIPATTECRVDDVAYAACSSPDTLSALTDGMHSFDVRATADSQMAAAPTYSFAVDTKAPALMITGQPAQMSPVATAQFHFMTDDALTASVTCQLDSQAAAACTSQVSYTGLADGSHTFTLSGTDGAGNVATATYTWTIDTSAPSLSITQEPPDPNASTSAQFIFTIGNSATVTCQLDSQTATACTSPVNYTALAQGAHTFTLKGTNLANQTTTRTYTWTVDTVAPTVSIDSAPAANTNVTTAQFMFTVNGATTVTCALDTGAAATCSTPWSYASLADGAHTFTLKAVDLAGNTTVKTHSWTVDTVPPSITLTSAPSNPSNTTAAAFAFTITGGPTTNTCQLDSAAAASCTTSASYSGLAQGNHTFTLKATDAAGNPATKSFAWSVDSIAPVLALTATPAANSSSATAHFAFTTDDAVTITCQLDSQAAAACAMSADYSGLGEGSHTFVLRGTDAAGNAASKTFTWSVDTVAPTVSLSSPPHDPSNNASPSFTFSTTGSPSSITCQLDGGAAAACASPFGYSNLADGSHTFIVKVSDAAGNSASQTYTWTIDTVAPTVTFSSTPAANSNSTTGAFAWSVSETANVTCQVDGGQSVPCSSGSYTTPAQSDGPHTFVVYAQDSAGNMGQATYSWKIDTVTPTVHIYSFPAGNTRNPSFSYTVSEGGTSNSYGLDLSQFGAAGDPLTLTGLADGVHTISIFAKDAAGNQGGDSYTWTIDATAPAVTLTSATCDPSGVTATWTASDANLASGTCALGGHTYDCTNIRSITVPVANGGKFSVSYTDAYGNVTTRFSTVTFTSACETP